MANRARSSAKKIWDILGPFLLMLMGDHSPWWAFLSMSLESLSIHKMKRYDNSGSPCLMPLVGMKGLVCSLLTRTEMVEELTHAIMRLVIVFGKLKPWRVSFMKDHSSLSKAFSKSILIIVLGDLPFIFPKCVMYSYTMMALSEALLFERKLVWLGPIMWDR